jgi:hypothetical protein
MASLKEQFESRESLKPKPKWVYGDRVSSKIGKIPVIGMVIRENYVEPDMVLCHLDLPVKYEGEYRWVLYVPSKGMKRLKVYDES